MPQGGTSAGGRIPYGKACISMLHYNKCRKEKPSAGGGFFITCTCISMLHYIIYLLGSGKTFAKVSIFSVTVFAAILFQPGSNNALDKIFLGAQEQDEHWQRYQHGSSHHLVPHDTGVCFKHG